MKITGMSVCPYCGSENWEWMNNDDGVDNYHCHECDRWFNEEDYEFETLRHQISAKISMKDNTEDNPLKCEVVIGEAEAQGLSDREKPKVIGLFHDPDAVVWVILEDYPEPMDFDWLSLDDAKAIWEELKFY